MLLCSNICPIVRLLFKLMFLSLIYQFALVIAVGRSDEKSPLGDVKLCSAPSLICPNEDVKYYLFTSKLTVPYKLSFSEQTSEQIQRAPFLLESPLKILLPGAQSVLMKDEISLLIIPAYLNSSMLNLLYVEYFKYSNVSFCPLIYTRYLGECIAKRLLNIYKYLPMFTPEHTHIIGGSMGSLVASYVGSYFEGSIFRITALDPPEYLATIYQPPVVYNLSPKVAKIVDAYHTNMGHLGTWKTVGTVDVIFNKGDEQPQCYSSSKCSHRISIYYFMLTIINRKAFRAQPCTYRLYDYLTNEIDQVCSPLVDRDRQLVGEFMDSETKGTFFVNTWPEFALGKT